MIELKDLIALITVCATMIAGLCLLLFKNLKVRVDVLERDCVNVQKECAGKPHISLERLERKIE